KWTLGRDKYQAMRELCEAGVPASAVLDTKDLFENPHLEERGFIHTVEHEVHGSIRLLGWPARMSESEVPITASPRLGRHTVEVVAEDLSMKPATIDKLLADGVISQAEPLQKKVS
ncbi:MAG: CoA transferase, partial [Pseudomonadales bacterium]